MQFFALRGGRSGRGIDELEKNGTAAVTRRRLPLGLAAPTGVP